MRTPRMVSVTHVAAFVIAVLLITTPAQTVGAGPRVDDSVASHIDWSTGTLHVTVVRPIDTESTRSPASISQTQRAIRRDAPRILFPIFAGIQLDSLHTVGSLAAGHDGLIAGLERAALRALAVDASASRDLAAARVTFSIDLYRDLAPELVFHTRPASIETPLGWVPHTEYTGILIYAADSLPLFGTGETVRLQPALFPAVHYLTSGDGLLYRLAGSAHIDPGHLVSRGPAAYTTDPEAAEVRARIGEMPLRILAVAAFGSQPVDIVIAEHDARQIMASANNRSLLRDGRVVIVVDAARTADE
jgi:hypothetical protein